MARRSRPGSRPAGLLLLLFSLLVTPAVAQVGSIGIQAGPAFAVGTMGDSRELADGWTGGVSLLASFARLPLDFEFGAGYAEHAYDDAGPAGHVETWIAGASVAWRPVPPAARLQPYVLGGLGVYYVEEPDRNRITPALTGGAGVRVAFRKVQLYAEARYLHVFYAQDDLRLVPVVLGLRYVLTP